MASHCTVNPSYQTQCVPLVPIILSKYSWCWWLTLSGNCNHSVPTLPWEIMATSDWSKRLSTGFWLAANFTLAMGLLIVDRQLPENWALRSTRSNNCHFFTTQIFWKGKTWNFITMLTTTKIWKYFFGENVQVVSSNLSFKTNEQNFGIKSI